MTNAGIAFRTSHDISVNGVWIIDGVLKLSFGSLMFALVRNAHIA